MPPIHPDWVALSDQSTAISLRVAAKVMSGARFTTRPTERSTVALLEPARIGVALSWKACAISRSLVVGDCLPSQIAYRLGPCSPNSDSIGPENLSLGLEWHYLSASGAGATRVWLWRSSRGPPHFRRAVR